MIINPSAHTVIPRTKAFRIHGRYRKKQDVSLPGGKQLFFAVTKLLSGVAVFLLLTTLWQGSSIRQVEAQISTIEMQRDQLVNANILMRAKKANLFSPEAVGVLAENQFAIHLPGVGQYRFIQ
jgi:hypothetical protein